MLHFGVVWPDERGLITNPLRLAAVRLTLGITCEGRGSSCRRGPRQVHPLVGLPPDLRRTDRDTLVPTHAPVPTPSNEKASNAPWPRKKMACARQATPAARKCQARRWKNCRGCPKSNGLTRQEGGRQARAES